jgi:hypothetical protein
MFHFDYIGYGEFYIVMSDTSQGALEALKKYLFEKSEGNKDWRYMDYLKWKNVTLDNLPNGYSLEEYDKNEVFEGEWS